LSQPRVVLTDACVLINLALAGRLELFGALADLEFQVPEEVLAEILRPRERTAVHEALGAGFLRQTSIAEPETLAIFAELRRLMGMGEAACLALVTRSGALVASDEKRQFLREAEKRLGPGRLLSTPGLFLLAIRRGALTVEEADAAKAVLERHRFRMTFTSFRELV
jgi:predicted nucleic acid-binding protein